MVNITEQHMGKPKIKVPAYQASDDKDKYSQTLSSENTFYSVTIDNREKS